VIFNDLKYIKMEKVDINIMLYGLKSSILNNKTMTFTEKRKLADEVFQIEKAVKNNDLLHNVIDTLVCGNRCDYGHNDGKGNDLYCCTKTKTN